jgi:hypothetical protein
MRSVSLLLAAAALTSCSTAMAPSPQVSARSQAQLQQMLAGRVSGPPVSCLPPGRSGDMTSIAGGTVVFRSGSTYYVNDMRGSCHNLNSQYALVTRQYGGSSLCSGEIAQLLDPGARITVGSCTFGDFIPFRRPGR